MRNHLVNGNLSIELNSMISITPKLNPSKKSTLYPYYAGYSYDFVLEVLSPYKETRTSVLDPWSGTGLTSVVAKQLGLESQGFDINPVMTIIAKANNIHNELSPSILSISQDIIKRFHYNKSLNIDYDNEPLNLWFDKESSQYIRSLELLIYKVLVSQTKRESLYVNENNLTSLSSFFYVALFRFVKDIVKNKFSSSNPTWIKIAKNEEQKISFSKNYLIENFNEIIQQQLLIIQQVTYFNYNANNVNFMTANSKNLPVKDKSVNCILTSPPYCTRIDYAVSMRPELAILGLAHHQYFQNFRQELIGSPTIRQNVVQQNPLWGNSCNDFLDKVKAHSSVASSGYYHTNLVQYFDDMYNSFTELSRVCKPNAMLGLVVQDSFYKELHNDLATFFEEMLLSLNFIKTDSISFKSNSLNNINPKSIKYQKQKKPVESFLKFHYTGTNI